MFPHSEFSDGSSEKEKTMAAKKDKTKVKRVRSTEDKNLLISSLIYIVLGAMLCIFRTELLKYAMLVVGIIAIVIGVLAIIKGDLIYGVVTAAIGALIILGGFLFLQIILLVIGVILAAKGVIELIACFRFSKINIIALLSAIFTIVLGVLLIASTWQFVDTFLIVIGVLMIVDGVFMFFGKKLV